MRIDELKDYHVVSTAPGAPKPQTAKNLAIGAAKGLGDSAMGLVKIGRAAQAAVDPTRTIADVNRPYEQTDARYEEALKSDNKTQKTGKVLEFAAEFLFPVSKIGKAKAGASFEGLGSRVSALSDEALSAGGNAKDDIIDFLVGLDDKTKDALSRTTPERFKEITQKARDAMTSDRNRTPLESVGDTVIDALKQVKDRASSVGQAKSQVMEQAKIGYNKVGNIAQKAALGIQKSFSGMKLDPADVKIVDDFKQSLMKLGNNPSLREVDSTIDLLQDKLYKAGRSNAVEVTDRITGKLRTELGKLNSQVKELGGQSYSKLNDEYGDLAETVRELNARLGKEGSSAGSLVKRLFSPSDARTKELFEKLEKLTGQDFFTEARLAKFTMETLGDTRAASLLEQIPTSAGGLANKALEYVVKKATDPIKQAEKFIQKGKELLEKAPTPKAKPEPVSSTNLKPKKPNPQAGSVNFFAKLGGNSQKFDQMRNFIEDGKDRLAEMRRLGISENNSTYKALQKSIADVAKRASALK